MSKKSKRFYRVSELGDWFASIGRTLKKRKKAGSDDQALRRQYIEVREVHRELNVLRRHFAWEEVYDKAFEKEKERFMEEYHYTEKKAEKFARIAAEYAVLEEFPDEVTTTRAVRNAMKKLE